MLRRDGGTERKKASRLEKQLRQRLATTQDAAETASIEADLHIAAVDRLYTLYFPYMERYVSLYPVAELGLRAHGGPQPEDQSSAARALHSERPALWSVIEKAMEQGEVALETLRDRERGGEVLPPKPPKPPKNSFTSKAREMRAGRADKANGSKRTAADTHTGAGPGGGGGKDAAVRQKATENAASESSDESGDSDDFFEEV